MAISFNEFYRELIPFRNWVAYKSDLRRLRFTYDDFIGFANEKIYDVWLRYNESLDKATMISVARTTLYKLPLHLNAKFGKFNYQEYLNREEGHLLIEEVPNPEETKVDPNYEKQILDTLTWGFDGLTQEEINMIKLILSPPSYILSRVKKTSKRIPTKLFLEFLDIPTTSQNIAKFNNYRRVVFKEAREFYQGVN